MKIYVKKHDIKDHYEEGEWDFGEEDRNAKRNVGFTLTFNLVNIPSTKLLISVK